MTLKIDAKFEDKLTCGLEKDKTNLANFYQSTRKSKNWDFDEILLSKLEMYQLKTYREVMYHYNE